MKIPASIASTEELGRGVFSNRNARRAERSQVPYYVFLERQGEINISVDRLSIAPEDESLEIAEQTGAARNKSFFGWATVTEDCVVRNGRQVVASPIPNTNPYHADIVLPEAAVEDREEQKRHAQELADASSWRRRPDP